MNQIVFNGNFVQANEKIAGTANRGLRYGDGLFETMKMVNGKILLDDYHRQRLFYGLALMKFKVPAGFTWDVLIKKATELARNNNCSVFARIRLMLFRDDEPLRQGGNGKVNYAIEASSLDRSYKSFHKEGIITGLHPDIRKSCDKFSNLKSANYLPYVMAAVWAKEKNWDDCLILNSNGRISDSSVANVFLIKNGRIFTPALAEGCVAGVLRRYLVDELPKRGYAVSETVVSISDIESADEIFLTNALYGIRKAAVFGKKMYAGEMSALLYKEFIEPMNFGN